MSKGVLVDISKCMGCKACQTACKQWNDLPSSIPEFDNNLGFPAKTDGYTYTTVLHRAAKKNGEDTLRFAKQQCLHCLEPACASACFAKALYKTPEGPVVYNPSLCVGCRYCMLACPFYIPKYQWDKTFPLVSKCQFCFDPNGKYDRLGHNQAPACVDTCPTGALKFGEREDLIKEARQRINENPAYVKHIYGEKEAGGTSWLYISDVPFETFGFPTDVTETPLPEYTHDYLKYTPAVIAAWGGLLTLMYLYTKRRSDVAKDQNKNVSV